MPALGLELKCGRIVDCPLGLDKTTPLTDTLCRRPMQDAEQEDYEEKLKEIQDVCGPIISKVGIFCRGCFQRLQLSGGGVGEAVGVAVWVGNWA